MAAQDPATGSSVENPPTNGEATDGPAPTTEPQPSAVPEETIARPAGTEGEAATHAEPRLETALPEPAHGQAPGSAESRLETAPPAPAPAEVGSEAPADPAARPQTAVEALDRATAAYRFGDLPQMVTMSRLVAEGGVPSNDRQRARALQLLGVGLYLSGRHEGAELAFTELLQLDPEAELDPTQTRPEVVAFFRRIQRQNRPKKSLGLAFLPPFGQFQNDTPVRGWVLLGLEALTLTSAVTTFIILETTKRPGNIHTIGGDNARLVKTINWASWGALAATWTYGVIDALLGMGNGDPDESFATLTVFPNGAAIRVPF